jgi:hypothetical protein
VVARAHEAASTAWPTPLASDAVRVHTDGDRTDYERAVFARQDQLSAAAVAAAITGSREDLAQVSDGVVLLCEQSSWCWPAHDDAMARHGSALPVMDDPFLDLGAGEVVAQLAWIDHLLGPWLDRDVPGLRARMRHEALQRVFTPFVSRRDWHWLGLDGDVHNWNPWIHSNVLVAALRLLDGPEQVELRSTVAALCWEGLDRYVTALPDDGAIDEGYGYWWNGACRALEALELFRHATDGVVDVIGHVPALRNTVSFPHRMHLGGDWFLNLADAEAKPPTEQPWQSLYTAAKSVACHEAEAFAVANRAHAVCLRPGLGRLLCALTDVDWLQAQEATPVAESTTWLPSVQVLVARERDRHGLTLAVKGGHNDENHNHLDVGSFVVASGGVPLVVDVGRPTYTATTFGPDRYENWVMTSRWHNVPRIGGHDQVPGRAFAARHVELLPAGGTSGSAGLDGLRMDLAGAYPLRPDDSWHREALLDRNHRQITVEDTVAVSNSQGTNAISLVLNGTPRILPGSIDVLPFEDVPAIRIEYEPATETQVTVRELEDPLLTHAWGPTLTRLRIPLGASSTMKIRIRQLNTNEVRA